MTDPTQAFTKNSFVDKCMKLIPEDALVQSQYMYYLTLFVFLGLLGYACVSWYNFFVAFSLKAMFSGIFMLAVALMSLFGLKQTRNMYIGTKQLYEMKNKQIDNTSLQDMYDSFKK